MSERYGYTRPESYLNFPIAALSSQPVQQIPIVNALFSASPAHSSRATHLYFLPDARAGACLLYTCTANFIQSYRITREPYTFSEAFANLENHKEDPPSTSSPAENSQARCMDWVIKPHARKDLSVAGHEKKALHKEGKEDNRCLLMNVLSDTEAQLLFLFFQESDGRISVRAVEASVKLRFPTYQ